MRVAVVVLVIVYAAALVIGAFSQSVTTDEAPHLAAGLAILQLNQFGLYSVNPPLVKMVAAFPALFMQPSTDWEHASSSLESRNEFQVGFAFVEQNGQRSLRLFRAARLACLPFSLLGFWTCFCWGRDLHGERGALLAAGLWAFSPMILGHGSLITPDVPAAATGVLAVYQFRRWLNESSLWNAVWLGVFAGIALLTKFTWAPLFPMIGLTGWLLWRAGEVRRPSVLLRDFSHLVLTTLTALYAVNAVYGFDESFKKLGDIRFVSAEFTKTPTAGLPTHDSQQSQTEPRVNRFKDTWLGALRCPVPELYLQGIDLQRRDFEPGRMGKSYLMGEWSDEGWWYYYLIGVLIKEPVASLILLAASLFSLIRLPVSVDRNLNAACSRFLGFGKPGQTDAAGTSAPLLNSAPEQCSERPIREYLILLIPAVLVFALVSRETGFNHHVRYVIPSLPFLFVVASRVILICERSRACLYGMLLLVAWQVLSVGWYCPHWLSYFNEIADGPDNGDRWLLNSNIDWGQDLLHLRAWQDRHPDSVPFFTLLHSRYSPAVYGIDPVLPDFITDKPKHDVERRSSSGNQFHPEPGWYAISVSALHGQQRSVFSPGAQRAISSDRIAWFKDRVPVDGAGYSIRIYRVASETSAAESTLQESTP